ncbi:MAG: PEP-CTERM sorting domain-containing protein [Nostoc sp.]|uniref:PEP-CTERM sorting domain-containing protein n=1 Tax=Nostoc sp. TaxID=1180 RepID=UPI002FF835BF
MEINANTLTLINDSNVTVPSNPIGGGNSGQSSSGGNISIGAGTITITSPNVTVRQVPEPSAIAGVILASGLAWLAKRKQTPL